MKCNNNHNSKNQSPEHSHKAFDNPEMFVKKFDGAERDEWQKPNEVIKALNLSSNSVVIEIGAGTGYFTVRLAEHLKDGKVLAIDEAPKMVAYLKKRIDTLKLTNVEVRLSEKVNNIHLQEKADIIMCVDSYHHIPERTSYFSHLIPSINHDGKIIIIDRAASAPVAPPPKHRTPPELVKKEMEQAGFELAEELDFLLPHQFYLAFKPLRFNKK